jgi:hypothetical protein
MKALFSIFVLFASFMSFGQTNNAIKSAPYSSHSIFIYDTIPKSYLTNDFSKTTKYKTNILTFDSNMTYHYLSINKHSDTSTEIGYWNIENKVILKLKSSRNTLKFNFAKYGKCRFLFRAGQKQQFKDDLISEMKIYRIRIDDKSMTQIDRDNILYRNMCEKYYCQISNTY